MADQPHQKPLSANPLFADRASSRPLPPHTVARGDLREDDHFFSGKVNGRLADTFPERITPALLQRGRERYEIYCAVCHGSTGEGNGIVAQRGFPIPPSLHLDRLREAPVGHFFEVISNGYGVMASYASRIKPGDRWAVTAYIRALQLSQHAVPADAELAARTKLETEAQP
jgi:mono/diheme cytochrome c family protein